MRNEREHKRKRLRVDGAFDIECHGWHNFLVGVTITKDGEVKVHYTPESMVDAMLEYGGSWWGHNSGKYDSLQVLEILRQRGISQSVSMSGSRVTRTMGGGLTIRDSYALVPLGLDALARMGGRVKPRLWFDCTCQKECGGYCQLRKRMPRYQLDKVVEYCIQDCEGLLYGLRALQEFADENDYDLLGTIGGSSWATARRVLGIPDADYSASQWSRIRSAYYGGRCSVLRPNVRESGTHWDMGSAYPWALADTELPVGEAVEHGARSARRALSNGMPGVYSCTVVVPASHVPVLPWGWGHGISFPTGVVSGAWTLPEIQYAESQGCNVQSVHWSITWPRTERIFSDWVHGIYDKRTALGKESPWGKWLRLFPNSLCGKMAERPEKRFLRMNPPLGDIKYCEHVSPCTTQSCSGVCGAWEQVDRWGEMWSVPFFKPSESGHIQWASYITAASRQRHHQGILSSGTDAVYCDTDSLWTTSSLAPVPTGGGLGQWARKCGFVDFEAPSPKAYAYSDEETGEYIVCAAGATLSSREWTEGESIQDRGVLSILDAARSGRGLFTHASRRWTVPKHGEWYGDRRIGNGGLTHAVTCDELRMRLNERNRERSR